MLNAEFSDCDSVSLPASMQTLLDRYTDRKLTAEERLVLAHATPNVRCEALRIFFEMNDAAAGVEYVLAHGGASPRSHGGASARTSLSSITASTVAAVAPAASPTKMFGSFSINTSSTSKPKPKGKPKAASLAKGHLPSALLGNALVPRDGGSSTGMAGDEVSGGGRAGPSRVKKGRSRSRPTGAAWREESVCTLVTVSPMSSEPSGDEDTERQSVETDASSEGRKENMPPTVTPPSRRARSNTNTEVAHVVPALSLDTVLKPSTSNTNRSRRSPRFGFSHGEHRSSVGSTGTNTTSLAANARPRELCPSVAPLLGAHSQSLSVSVSSATATAAAPVSLATAPTPLSCIHHEDFFEDGEARKTVASKPMSYYADPTALLTPPAPHPQEKNHGVISTHSKNADILAAHPCHPTPTLGLQSGAGRRDTVLSSSHNRTSPCSAPPLPATSAAGSGGYATASLCTTDWPALIAAARPPQLPTASEAALKHPSTALPASVREEVRAASGVAGDTAPVSSQCCFCEPTIALPCRGSADKTRQPQRMPRVYFHGGNMRGSESSGKHASRKALDSRSGSAFTSPLSPSSRTCGVSPINRGVAWDEATGTYVTHPNQLRRRMTPRGEAVTEARPLRSSAPEIPDTLHFPFSRTASAVMGGDTISAVQLSELPTRIRATTAPAHAARQATGSRLCPSVPHRGVGGDAGFSPALRAAVPLTEELKKKKRKSRAKGSATAAKAQSGRKSIKRKNVAATLSSSPKAPSIDATPPTAGYHRLPSNGVCPKVDVSEHKGGAIALQRRDSQYTPKMLPATEVGSPNKVYRSASRNKVLQSASGWAPASRIAPHPIVMNSGDASSAGTGPDPMPARVHNFSALRTPRSARLLAQQRPRRMRPALVAAVTPLHEGAGDCTHHLYRISSSHGSAAMPPAQCNVFERLSSNYYNIYTSSAALYANPTTTAAASPRGGHSVRERPQQRRRRNLSAPAASVRRLPLRCLHTPKGGVCEGRPGSVEAGSSNQKLTPAPASILFSGSRTPRHPLF